MHIIYDEFDDIVARTIRSKLSDYKNEQFFDTDYVDHEIEPPEGYDVSDDPINDLPVDQWAPEENKPYFKNDDGDLVYSLDSYPGEFFVMDPETREERYEWYSNWDGSEDAVNTICRRVGMRRNWFVEWKRKEGLTHDSEPFTDEQILDQDTSSLTNDLLMMRKKKLWKDWREKEQKEVMKAAEKHWQVEKDIIEPVVEYLDSVDDLSIDVPDYDITFGTERSEPYALFIGLGDTHIGRTVHGEHNHTVEDTIKQIFSLVNKVLGRAMYWGKPDEVYLLFLGDIFQYDTENRETGSGNRRNSIGIPSEVLDAGFSMANNLVSMMKSIAPTTVRVVPGNHDPILSRSLLWQMHDKWKDDIDIALNWDRQQYVRYKNNLVGLTHACRTKPKQLTDIMPRDASELWGETDNRYYLYGHPHRPSIRQPDDTDIELIGVGAPIKNSEHEHQQGYVNRPRFGALLMAPDEGRVGMPSAGMITNG